MARKNPDGSHRITRFVNLTGRENEGDKGLIVMGRNHARVVNQTADPATEELVERKDVSNIRRIHDVTTGKRQVLTLPKDLCRRLNIDEGTPLRIVEHEGRFEVIPMRLVAASEVPPKDLDALLARVTPENIHGEIDTGPSVGEEAW